MPQGWCQDVSPGLFIRGRLHGGLNVMYLGWKIQPNVMCCGWVGWSVKYHVLWWIGGPVVLLVLLSLLLNVYCVVPPVLPNNMWPTKLLTQTLHAVSKSHKVSLRFSRCDKTSLFLNLSNTVWFTAFSLSMWKYEINGLPQQHWTYLVGKYIM